MTLELAVNSVHLPLTHNDGALFVHIYISLWKFVRSGNFSSNSFSYFINCYVLKGIVESMDVFIYIIILRKVSLCMPCWPQTLYVALNSFCIVG